MKTPIELKHLLKQAQVDFGTLNHDRRLTKADKDRLKEYYLQQMLVPRTRASLQRLQPSAASNPSKEQFLTAQDLRRRFKISVKTLYKYAQSDSIPHVRMGRTVRFPEREIERWIAFNMHYARARVRTSSQLMQTTRQSKRRRK